MDRADERAIELLHQKDMAAARAGDAATLASLWTEDIVVLPPNGPVIKGKAANLASLKGSLEQLKQSVITEYLLSFEEVKIVGEYAFEWGTYRGSSRPKGGGEEVRESGKLMRILARQSDGSWKVARTIWNTDTLSKSAEDRGDK